ncbi:hypothetical protein [Vibrio sonorensis]|uniref:hypothetical protein n=1 Tax=Vibrio sonorensis TaxID=1004316 RepID=UPI0008DA1D04|nr:hypothetical protein [Vibrio sonorensis]
MTQQKIEQYLARADQPVKDFMAEILEALAKKLSGKEEPIIKVRYFGARLEIKLLSFDGVYKKRF